MISRLGVNVSPIVIHLFVIFQIPNQMWIIMEEDLILIPLFDFKNHGLLDAPKAKPFANWHSFH
jgi:hypothetical protein